MQSLNFLLTFLFYVFVASPLCLVRHEMGHAVIRLRGKPFPLMVIGGMAEVSMQLK
jgi:hypothetical protein